MPGSVWPFSHAASGCTFRVAPRRPAEPKHGNSNSVVSVGNDFALDGSPKVAGRANRRDLLECFLRRLDRFFKRSLQNNRGTLAAKHLPNVFLKLLQAGKLG